jgi:hypothetical protein
MSRGTRISPFALLLCVCLFGGTASDVLGQTTQRNTRRLGNVAMPEGTSTKGLWGYESGGKQYCLQTRGSAGMSIVDMTDPSTPTIVATVPGTYRKVQVWQDYAYATTDSGPTAIIDMTTPAAPVIVNTLAAGAHTLRIDQTNGRLYLNRSSSIGIYDLTADPTTPQQLGSWAGGAHDCRPDGDTLYANGFVTGPTKILDVRVASNIVQLGTLPDGNHSSDLYVSPTGQRVLITCDEQAGGHVNLHDVTNPAAPQLLSSYQVGTSTSVHNVEVRGAYAFVAYYQNQLRVLDLTDPTNPLEVGIWDDNPGNAGGTYSDAWEVFPDHDALYMNQMYDSPAGTKGLHALDFFPAFGAPSDGTGGQRPEIWWSYGPPSPGNERFALRLDDALPNTTAYLIIGSSNTIWGASPLPLAMGVVGAPNANLYTSVDILISVTTDAQGQASIALPIPSGVPYTVFYCQWAVKDPGAPNPGGWAFTKGGKLVIY